MPTIYTNRPIEPSEIYCSPDDKTIEFVDTDIVVRDMSVESSWIAGKILRIVGDHAEGRKIGWIFGADLGCRCFQNEPNLVRKPDVTFVRSERFSVDQIGEVYLRVIPDLVVEVISPNDSYEEVEAKIELFCRVKVPLIWVVSPRTRTIRIYRADGSSATLRDSDELSGEGIVPGFTCPVSAIFPPKI